MARFRIGIVGLGKIATDQHVPVIGKGADFEVAAVASQRGLTVGDTPTFPTPEAMLAGVPDLDAVAVCTPPQQRHRVARLALAAGRHVLLEKPPAMSLSELADLRAFAESRGRVLFATWHSQYNDAVAAARDALRGQTLKRLQVTWKEDVRRWHPGQAWIWRAGGFGVFDPGINALSIVTRIMPEPIFVRAADLLFPSNCEAPIAARLTFATPTAETGLAADFDWRQEGDQTWDIEIETRSGQGFRLTGGGRRLEIDGKLVAEAPSAEYEAIYDHFAKLLRSGQSEVDEAPLRLVADSFLVGRRLVADPFED
jgi:D-galactose 1-dehydrogenase